MTLTPTCRGLILASANIVSLVSPAGTTSSWHHAPCQSLRRINCGTPRSIDILSQNIKCGPQTSIDIQLQGTNCGSPRSIDIISQCINCGSPRSIDIISQSSNCKQELLVFYRQVQIVTHCKVLFFTPCRGADNQLSLWSSLDCKTADLLFNHMST